MVLEVIYVTRHGVRTSPLPLDLDLSDKVVVPSHVML